MPTYRRRSSIRQIAKLNATSIDGYFGEGSPCFFIRGTILSDVQVDGEYRTLSIRRPGNVIEIESFDGEWATVVVTTRAGSRAGDNLRARVMLRESDLRGVGIDCEQILAGIGSFEEPMDPPPEIADSAPAPMPEPAVLAAAAFELPAGFAPWIDPPGASHLHSNGTNGSNGSSNGVAHVEEPAPVPEPASPRAGGRSQLVDGKIFVEIGASVIAVALPVLLFFLRSLFTKKDDR
jgi:hypothetical protein